MTKKELQAILGVTPDGNFGPVSKNALMTHLTNPRAPAMTQIEIAAAACRLGVSENHIKAVKKVEAPRGAFDQLGRPTILFEKHKFGFHTNYKYNDSHPDISSKAWKPGTYGPFSGQYSRFLMAAGLDPDAAIKSCSWGAFQVMGEHAIDLGYATAFDMALSLVHGEYAHLETFMRFIEKNHLVDELRACKPGDSKSCIPFVSKYNGPGYAKNRYHINFAEALKNG